MRQLELHRTNRRAFTLIELLIVLLIAMLLAAAAIPLIRPAFQDRKVREATRQLNAFCANAKAMAAERNRPYGVWLARSPGNLNQCVQVFIAEVQPPYSGDVLNAKVKNGTGNILDFGTGAATLTVNPGGLLASGDSCLIRFDYKGSFYSCTFNGTSLLFNTTTPTLPASGVPFEIYRNPKKSIVSPLELSNGIAIDLGYSGLGAGGAAGPYDATAMKYLTTQYFGGTGMDFDAFVQPVGSTAQNPDSQPIVILFSPGGQVSEVFWKGTSTRPTGPIHLLVGRNETIALQDASNSQTTNPKLANSSNYGNLQDMSSLWFTVGQRSSSFTTGENYWDPTWSPWTITATSPNPTPLRVDLCRQYVRTTQTKGGG